MAKDDTSASSPCADSLLNAWLAIEALNPQTCDKQENLIGRERVRQHERALKSPSPICVDLDLEKGVMPWETPQGDRRNLTMDENEAVRWFIPLGFIDMEPAVEALAACFEDDGPERERGQGLAIAALAAFNACGYPERNGFIVSSFAWACGKVLHHELDDLHSFPDLESELGDELHRPLVTLDTEGHQLPTSRSAFVDAMKALMAHFRLPRDLLKGPRIAIRIIGDDTEDALTIVNSFFLKDLHRVREAIKDTPAGPGLEVYLAGQQRQQPIKDVLADKAELERFVAPEITPAARWPSPRPVSLVTLQQAAVNAVTQTLGEGGVQGINGPPGTGKTTLVRDVVAFVLLERAKALAEFDDPEKAFTPKETVSVGSSQFTLHTLAPTLRGFGMVAASANNAAVENISRELPGAQAVEPSLNISYFQSIAQSIAGDESPVWGLVAAVLGRARNRQAFVDAIWWHDTHNLRDYLKAPCGQLGVKDKGPPVVTEEDPPRSRRQALARWMQARAAFLAALDKAENRLQMQRRIRAALKDSAAVQQAKDDAEQTAAKAEEAADEADRTVEALQQTLRQIKQDIDDDRLNCSMLLKREPAGIKARLTGSMSAWLEAMEQARLALDLSRERQRRIETDLVRAKEQAGHALKLAAAKREEAGEAKARLDEIKSFELKAGLMPAECVAGPEFWEWDHETLHKAAPWGDPETQTARDELFKAVMELHRAFIDAAALSLHSNLALFMSHLKGRSIPSGPDAYLADLWDTFFLVVPLVSTTFASFARLFHGLAPEALGWLLIDEAGQASPQTAVGAIWRSKRALVVGDPLQIEPVVTIPKGLRRSIFAGRGLDPDRWSAPEASVQTLADQVSRCQTEIKSGEGERRVGLPLLVHRRCAEPMFTIANEIAYGGLMVHAVPDQPSPLLDALRPEIPGSCWLHIESRARKWNDEEGRAVLDFLDRLMIEGIVDPDIYFISPFKDVARRLKQILALSKAVETFSRQDQKSWVNKRVGTVHTFQGKEAQLVFLVLGASAKDSGRSRAWASITPNILNVAATRARHGLIIVGNHDAWRQSGCFQTAADPTLLPVIDWPLKARVDESCSRTAVA